MSIGPVQHSFSEERVFPSPRHRVPEAGGLYQAPERLLSKISCKLKNTPVILNIVAPVGYGKTNLAAAVGRSFFSKTIWLSLAEEYSDGLNFRTDLIQSFRESGFPLSKSQDLNKIFDKKTPVCLVLDNLHLLPRGESRYILELFAILPKNSLMVICSDEDHSLPLSRLRTDDLVLEIRIEDLSATRIEIAAFFRCLGASPLDEELDLILRKTDGWWACIRLFAITWRQLGTAEKKAFLGQFKATDRFIREFLTENIDTRISRDHLEFLETISICTHIRTELAANITELQESTTGTLVRELEARFILLPTGHGWYRLPLILKQHYYSHLDRIRREQLHSKASQWFHLHHMSKSASYHLLKSGMHSPLAPRETEILVHAAQGLSNAEIGERLFISQGTVKWHMNRILEKLGCSNRTAAVETARKKGFISS